MSWGSFLILAATVGPVSFGAGYLLARWLRRRFADEAFKFELFEAENREAVDEIIKRKEATDQ